VGLVTPYVTSRRGRYTLLEGTEKSSAYRKIRGVGGEYACGYICGGCLWSNTVTSMRTTVHPVRSNHPINTNALEICIIVEKSACK